MCGKKVDLEDFDLRSKTDDDMKGFIIEVDLGDLHDLYNDYPLALEKTARAADMLSH